MSPASFLPERVCTSAPAVSVMIRSWGSPYMPATQRSSKNCYAATRAQRGERSQALPSLRSGRGVTKSNSQSLLPLALRQGLEVFLDHFAVPRRQVLGQFHHRLGPLLLGEL